MNEQKNNGRGMFYGVIGVATLVVAIIGATFAYFTATASNNNVITGNMATIQFGLSVAKVTHVDENKGGMIPMSNTMVEAAVSDDEDVVSGNAAQTCVDANGNAVCQIYKITVTNTGSATLFLDGYVTLTGGSGVPTDSGSTAANKTSMRWAQVFCTGTEADEITGCTTIGKTTTGADATKTDEQTDEITAGITDVWGTLADKDDATGLNNDKILTTMSAVTAKGAISGNPYDIINTNYIRISDHAAAASYVRENDITSALVFNQYLDAADATKITDEVTYYIVVWLTETGTNQTVGSGLESVPTKEEGGLDFFSGTVTFNSAQGSEVTATFSGYTAVPSQTQQAG